MSDTPPDRLSNDPRSPFFDQAALERGVGIRFRGAERRDVEEYDLAGGWVRVALGKKVDRHGRPLTLKLSGPIEAWFHDAPAAGTAAPAAEDAPDAPEAPAAAGPAQADAATAAPDDASD